MSEKLKSLIHNDQVFFSSIVLLVALTSFGLGRASVAQTSLKSALNDQSFPSTNVSQTEERRVFTPLLENRNNETNPVPQLTLIASKSGTKYHLESCPGAKQIKESNVIKFYSIAEAEAAGYKPAVNCPGLQ